MRPPILRGSVWYCDYDDEYGRRIKRAMKARTRKEAEEMNAELALAASRRKLGLRSRDDDRPNPERLTLADLMKRYLDTMLPTTKKKASGLIRLWIIETKQGDLFLEEVTTEKLEQLAVRASKKLAAVTTNKIRTHLHAAFKYAQKTRLWKGDNPAAAMIVRDVPPHAYDTLTLVEIERMLVAMANHNGSRGAWRVDLAAMSVMLGLRRGELLAVDASWVDVENDRFSVRGSHGRTVTKTGDVREVPLYDAVRPYVLRALERVGGKGLLFPSTRKPGERLNEDLHVSAWIKRALRDAGIDKRLRFHDLRHTAATAMVEAGLDLKAVALWLGHASVKTTERYTHPGRKYLRDESEKLSEAFRRAAGGNR